MLRITRTPFRWLALCGLIASAAARDLQAATSPDTTPANAADSSETQTRYSSYYDQDSPADAADSSETQTGYSSYYNQDPPAASDPTTLMSGGPTSNFQTAASTLAIPTASMPSSGCSSLGDCRNRCWQPFVGVEAVLLAPVQNHGGGGTDYSFTSLTTTNTYSTSSVNGMTVTPRLSMGVMGETWGLGFRYWRFNNTQGGETSPLGPGSSVFTQGVLKLQTFDLEAIRRFYYGNSQLWFSGGVRYAQFSRQSDIQATNIFGPSTNTGAASSGAGFNGTGITSGVFGLTPIGSSGWNLFYGGRTSILWDGSSSAFAQTNAASTFGPFSNSAAHSASGSGNGNAFVGELQLGAQYNHAMRSFRGTAFFRIAGEYQYWHINNGASPSSSSSATSFILGQAATNASAGNSTLGLLGFGVSTGFMW
jgi:hypothetical protein